MAKENSTTKNRKHPLPGNLPMIIFFNCLPESFFQPIKSARPLDRHPQPIHIAGLDQNWYRAVVLLCFAICQVGNDEDMHNCARLAFRTGREFQGKDFRFFRDISSGPLRPEDPLSWNTDRCAIPVATIARETVLDRPSFAGHHQARDRENAGPARDR